MTTKTRKRLVLLFAVLVFLGGYVGSFFAVRKTIVNRGLTTMALGWGNPTPPPERITLRLHYFSMDPRIHQAFYCVYYPIHSFLGGDIALLVDNAAAIRANPKLADAHDGVYVESPSDLRLGDSPADGAGAP